MIGIGIGISPVFGGGVSAPFSAYSFYDSFTGTGALASHTPEKGGAWTQLNGTGTLSGGSVILDGAASTEPRAVSTGGTTANGTYVFTASYDAAILVIKFLVNYADASNYWYAEGNPSLGGSAGTFNIHEVTAGVDNIRASGVFPAATTGCTMTVVTNGDSIQATVNGTTISYSVGSRANKTAKGLGASVFSSGGVNSQIVLDSITQIP